MYAPELSGMVSADLYKKLPIGFNMTAPLSPNTAISLSQALKPVLKVAPAPTTPQVSPTVNPTLTAPTVTPVATPIPQSMPVTTYDAAPATGGPNSGIILNPTPGADEEAGLAPASAGISPVLALGLLGAFLIFRKKGR